MKGREWPKKFKIGPGGLSCVCCTKGNATYHRRKANRCARRINRQNLQNWDK